MTAKKSVSTKDMNGLGIANLAPGSASTDAATKGQVDAAITTAESRANHTGTQLASTISDFNTQVRTSALNQMTAPTADLSINSHKLTNLLDPTVSTDAATKNYVDTTVAGVANGLVLKGAVVAASTVNVSVSSAPSTIDGITASAGQVFLLTGQTTGTENGPYVWNGAGVAMTRATNWNTSALAALGSFWVVEQGSKADSFAILTNDTAITLGTTVPTFAFISTATTGTTGYTTTSPSVTAGGTWTVSHNLNSRGVVVQVYRTASPYDDVDVYFTRTDVNTVTVSPDIAMASGEYTVVVGKVI